MSTSNTKRKAAANLDEQEEYVPYVPVKQRKLKKMEKVLKNSNLRAQLQTEAANSVSVRTQKQKSLLAEFHEKGMKQMTEEEKAKADEEFLLKHLNNDRAPLMAAKERAHGRQLESAKGIETGWKPAKHIRDMSEKEAKKIRDKWRILVDGSNIPNPTTKFSDMKVPPSVLLGMKEKGITRPTPIQVQAMPVLLSGRDLIGIAYTGSGKTLTFSLPLILFAIDRELKTPLNPGEGPVGLILCPSRELATQTHEVIKGLVQQLRSDDLPEVNAMLCIGGVRIDRDVWTKPIHIVVATPGKLLYMLRDRKLKMNMCQYLCLDEADRMIDMGFEEEVREMLDYIEGQKQMVLFSATMPKKIQEFALSALLNPVVVNVGRAGAASLDVIQEVEYVKREAKIVYLLECLQKTAPPVLIFASNQGDVDDIHEYLLVKGVSATAIHGGKSQEERTGAIKAFKNLERDVLVATDVASKGLDFPDIQHVINYDMPKEIEDYVHRIGRTGRCGKTGVATSFINRDCAETLLLDLKHLLKEAGQKIPPVLQTLDDPTERFVANPEDGDVACGYCGGLGHRITVCPKLESATRAKHGNISSSRSSMLDDGY